MIWLLFSVALYAINNIVWKLFVKDELPLKIINRRAIFTSLLALLAAYFSHSEFYTSFYQPGFIRAVIASLFGTAGLIMMVVFLKDGSLVRMGYYTLLGNFIAGIYTYMFGHTTFSPKTAIGTTLIICGYLIFLYNEKRNSKTEPTIKSQHILLAGMTLCFSLSMLIQWENLKILPALTVISTQEITVLLVSTLALFFFRKSQQPTVGNKLTLKSALMALVIFAGIFTGTIGLKMVNPFIASVSGVAVPVLTLFVASIVFHDKLNPPHLISLLLMIIGSVTLI